MTRKAEHFKAAKVRENSFSPLGKSESILVSECEKI